jgi:two-component system CheB/CheR fusion protein
MDTPAQSTPSIPQDQGDGPSQLDFPVVGMGASAGGLDALMRFFKGMPAHNGMAFVIVLHLSPTHESNLDSLLQRVTKMPVMQVFEAVEKALILSGNTRCRLL